MSIVFSSVKLALDHYFLIVKNAKTTIFIVLPMELASAAVVRVISTIRLIANGAILCAKSVMDLPQTTVPLAFLPQS